MRLVGMVAAVAAAMAVSSAGYGEDKEYKSVTAPPGGERAAGWTPERMERAKVREIPVVARAAIKRSAETTAAPGTTEAAPDPAEERKADLYKKPLNWVGKLFYKTPDGDYQCTAELISPQVILTAAQCVQNPETGEFYEDFVFALQYKDGKFLKSFGYQCAATNAPWAEPGDLDRYAFDYGTILIDGKSSIGHFGVHWDWGDSYKEATLTAYGAGFAKGEVTQAIKGKLSETGDGTVRLEHGKKASMSGGAGGGFVAKYSEAKDPKSNYIISVDSFTYDDEPGVDYGPYLDKNFKGLWEYTEKGCE